MAAANNPFKNGFKPTGKRATTGKSYLNKKALLKYMLDVDITVVDLPVQIADHIRATIPGFVEQLDRKFTMRQILEIVQLQLLFSRSDYVKQAAIIAIKDRIEGKPMQKIQVDNLDADPTEFILPNGRKIAI